MKCTQGGSRSHLGTVLIRLDLHWTISGNLSDPVSTEILWIAWGTLGFGRYCWPQFNAECDHWKLFIFIHMECHTIGLKATKGFYSHSPSWNCIWGTWEKGHMWHTMQCSSSCLTHHCSSKILFPSVSSQADADSFLPQWSCSAAALGNQGPFPGTLGKFAFSSPVEWSFICYRSCESFNCFNITFFSSELSFAEKLRDVRTQELFVEN